jgi:hypothetical protein
MTFPPSTRCNTTQEYTVFFADIGMTADFWATSRSIFLDSLLRSPYMEPDDREILEKSDSFMTRFYEKYVMAPALRQVKF